MGLRAEPFPKPTAPCYNSTESFPSPMISILVAAIPAPATEPPVQSRQEAILERIMREAEAPSERTFGECSYNWGSWKLSKEGIRTTTRLCGDATENVAVSCDLLKVNVGEAGKWGGWRSPVAKDAKKGEANMVAALCANIPSN